MTGCVIKTKFTVLDVCLEKVLSKTSPYVPLSPLGTSYLPSDTLSDVHFPAHVTNLRPMLSNFSTTLTELADPRRALFSDDPSRPGVGGGGSMVSEVGSVGVRPFLVPGCLKIPKLILFFCGCRDHDIVCCSATWTHRTT